MPRKMVARGDWYKCSADAHLSVGNHEDHGWCCVRMSDPTRASPAQMIVKGAKSAESRRGGGEATSSLEQHLVPGALRGRGPLLHAARFQCQAWQPPDSFKSFTVLESCMI